MRGEPPLPSAMNPVGPDAYLFMFGGLMSEPASSHRFACSLAAVLLLAATPTALVATQPLHVRIDDYLKKTSFGALSPSASDGEFFRRVYLDLAGTIPPADEAREFLSDNSPDKRAAAIERLLNSVQYNRYLANVLDVMLMERRNGKHIKNEEWQKYLRESVAEDKSWSQLVRELLAADGSDEKVRAAAQFYLAREAEPNLLTRDVGRVFFGMDLQCCQCHDHPLIDTYYQADYYGIFAFLNRGFLFTDKDKKVFYAEKAEGDVKFTSVFTDEKGRTRPRLPGDVEIIEPVFGQGDGYLVKPAKQIRPVPKYSRRAKLAEMASDGTNRAFNRNIANRLWAHMMGQGLVHPSDLQHIDNPPSHPGLLDLLAEEFVAMNFDIKEFLRQLALTETYQRSLEISGGVAAAGEAAARTLATLEADTERAEGARSTVQEQHEVAEQAFQEARTTANTIYDEFQKAGEAVAAAQKSHDQAAKKLADAKTQRVKKQEAAEAVQLAAEKARQAIAKLPDDKTLSQAAEVFQSRAEKLAAEVVSATKAVERLVPDLDKAAKKLGTVRDDADRISTRLEAANAVVGELRQPLHRAARALQAAHVAVLSAGSRLQTAKRTIEYARLVKTAQASQLAFESAQAGLQSARTKLELANLGMPQIEAAFVAAQTENDSAARSLGESEAEVRAKSEVASLVAAAAASAAEASSKLGDDEQVKLAAAQVKKKSDQIQAELARSQKTHDQHQQAGISAAKQLSVVEQQWTKAKSECQRLNQQVARLEAELPSIKQQAEQHGSARTQADAEISQHWPRSFFTASLQALTPEQMAWSVMQATGVVAQQRRAAATEVDKKFPLDKSGSTDSARLAMREQAAEEFVFSKLKGNVATFVKLFGHASGQPQSDFFATVDQALYFSNAGPIQAWLKPSGSNLTDRLNKLDEPRAVATELYISVLTRRPSRAETADVVAYLQDRTSDKAAALQEMIWGLITSNEFRFSH